MPTSTHTPPGWSVTRSRRRVVALVLTSLVGLGAWFLAPMHGSGSARADDAATPLLAFSKGDHVCLIGNTLAERMQFDAWLETLIQARFPEHDLVIRNLGFSGDELTLRLRSADFGTPDQHLTNNRADVILAFFGYNESYADQQGLAKFQADLEGFIEHTLSQKYNRKSAPKLVLFSPIAHENLKNPNLPDGQTNNRRLRLYTLAMAEIARKHKVVMVDLFQPSNDLYARSNSPLTINGVHLNTDGDKAVSEVIDRALFGPSPSTHDDPAFLENLRAVIQDKNFYFFNRYRTTDGYSIFGGRADLKFVNGQTNREVARREMEVLDVITANRDRRIWTVAKGLPNPSIEDTNTPPFIPVISNKPGAGPNGKHLYLSGEDAIAKMEVGKGLKVSLFASEEMFPELINPVQMAFDTKGRLWVACWPTYPHWKPKEAMNDKLLILEDTNGDGKADRCKTFVDDLHNPTGFEFHNGGVLVAMAPYLLFLKDTDGDDRADLRTRVIGGLDTADTHHTSNSFTLDPGGAIYFQEGTFHHSQVETPWRPSVRLANAGVFRYEPFSQKFEVYVSYPFANPHGHVWDRWGQDIVHDGTGAVPYHGALFSGRIDFPNKHNRPPQVYQQRTRPCPGTEILSSRHFPPEMQDNLLVGNVIGFQGILRYKIEDKDSSFVGIEQEPILSSTDPNFRPADFEMGPDGALYFTDWQNPIIGHMQHNLRDPNRDKIHGRVYKVTAVGRELLKPLVIDGASIASLLELLKEPENRTRQRARIELSERNAQEVVAAAQTWIDHLDPKDPGYQHQVLEGLWLHQTVNVVNIDLLRKVMGFSDFRARAAAARVLCYWRDRVPDALELFKQMAADEAPRVRLEAVRAASFFDVPEAVEVVAIASSRPGDVYIDFVRGETMRVLDPVVKQALSSGKSIAMTTPAGAQFLLRNMGLDELLKQARTKPVCLELLARPGVREEARREALAVLARLNQSSEMAELLTELKRLDATEQSREESVVVDLARLLSTFPAAELAKARASLEQLATAARQAVVREVGYVTLMNLDGSPDKAWELASQSVDKLRDLLRAVPLISDSGLRAALAPRIAPLLRGLPTELKARSSTTGLAAKQGRYVRLELPRRGTLTLAEVEVLANGRNLARQGKATQKNTSHGGDAARAIDGKTSPVYGDGGQTHSEENTPRPWWELDLGGEMPIESIVVWNRNEGDLGKRLAGYTLSVLDQNRRVVFRKTDNAVPEFRVAFALGQGDPLADLRRLAMNALSTIRGREAETFRELAPFVQGKEEGDRVAAIRAIQRIPRGEWPTDQAKPLLAALLSQIKSLAPADRTTSTALDAFEFADALAALLPVDQARATRAELRSLGVRVIKLGTLPERMAYDKDVLAVEAGKPVAFLFENIDLMPHNFVITKPGALEEVGLLAESTASQPGALERQYVPRSDKLLLASRLLQTRESQQLNFTAPTAPGVYPYVCTYPGHWRRMFGALYVVEDLDAYLADPAGYLSGHSLPVKDPLLAERRPRTEWTFQDLSTAVEQMSAGRSFSNAKQMFKVASCVSCHQMNGEGVLIGANLAELDPKTRPEEILKSLIEPSDQIKDQYKSQIYALDTGQVITGLKVDETPDFVKVVENPLAKAEVTLIKKSQIVERKASPTSIMPKGLLDKLTKDEALDLIAYLIARGNAKHPLFQGGSGGSGHGGHQH